MAEFENKDCTSKTLGVNVMLDHIMEELRYIRKRLDDHIDDEDRSYASIKEKLENNRTKITGIVTGATIIIMGFVGWLFSLVPK